MRLKTGLTYWSAKNPPRRAYPRLRTNARCDVAVVGAGITGALAAHALAEAGLTVIVLDKRIPADGSTSASTGLLLYETDTPLAELARRHGLKAALRCYALGRKAVQDLGRLAALPGIDCGFRRKTCLYAASDVKGRKQLRKEFHLRRRGGLPCEWLDRRALVSRFQFKFSGAIYSTGCAEINAQALAEGLLARQIAARRIRVFQGTRVISVKESSGEVCLRTGNRRRIMARHVIMATGYESIGAVTSDQVRLNVSYVIASQPQPPGVLWEKECLIWETSRPYRYVRTTPDRRILMGGADEPFTRYSRSKTRLTVKTRELRKSFHQLFPGIPFHTDYAWSGAFGESRDGLPFIGAKPGAPRVLYALGYGGNGITFGQIAATLLSRICQGQPAPDLRLFGFNR
jgi:glycine/D-amino acid oxidase-like deaminating enzyme